MRTAEIALQVAAALSMGVAITAYKAARSELSRPLRPSTAASSGGPMEMPDSIHLCCPPAQAMVGDYWQCGCDADWLYVHDMGARIPDWIRINAGHR